jgi:hypothetical protein
MDNNNNILFLVIFVFVIYFLFIRERENLEPEIPPTMPQPPVSQSPMVAPPVAQPPMVSQLPMVAPPVAQPLMESQPTSNQAMSVQEKEKVLQSLTPFLNSGIGSRYEEYVKHLVNNTNNKSKKLLTQESYNAIIQMHQSGNADINVLHSLMNDV